VTASREILDARSLNYTSHFALRKLELGKTKTGRASVALLRVEVRPVDPDNPNDIDRALDAHAKACGGQIVMSCRLRVSFANSSCVGGAVRLTCNLCLPGLCR
jgi:hypothetical protein